PAGHRPDPGPRERRRTRATLAEPGEERRGQPRRRGPRPAVDGPGFEAMIRAFLRRCLAKLASVIGALSSRRSERDEWIVQTRSAASQAGLTDIEWSGGTAAWLKGKAGPLSVRVEMGSPVTVEGFGHAPDELSLRQADVSRDYEG